MMIQQIVNSIFNSNTYILSDNENCWLIDVGDIDKICQFVLGKYELKGVFLTHSHFDHIYGLNKLIEHFPNCVIYISENGKEGLFDDRRNFSLYHERPLNFKGGNIQVVKDGDVVNLFKNIKIKCISTPGHDTSCMTYSLNEYLFTGDSYIPNEKPVTKLKGGDRKDYEISLKKILSLINSDTIVCPGHGEITQGEKIKYKS